MQAVKQTGGGAESWQLALDRATANAALSLVTKPTIAAVPAPGDGQIFSLNARRYLALRAWGVGSAGNYGDIDVLLWPREQSKAVRAARLRMSLGAQTHSGHPLGLVDTATTWREVDDIRHTAGPICPLVRSWPDEQAIVYIDCAEFAMASVRLQVLSGPTRMVVLARTCDSVPEPLEIPFLGTLVRSSSGAFTNDEFRLTDDVTDLAAPGSGWQYVIQDANIVTDTAVTIKIGDNSGLDTYYPQFTAPIGLTYLPIAAPGLHIPTDTIPSLTTGNFVGRVTIMGVIRPAWR